ncbi:hypothetical protein MUP05_06765 [Candidatus Bathyarchaeota archaeon]|nr:hypothetical protein [Candidatus Bathyarchaeota archaeon]
MQESEIIQAIEAKTKQYAIWTIGITDDPERRRAEHNSANDDTTFWVHWKADTETIARNVEKYFLDKGMKGSTGGGERPVYVYIF